MSAFRRDYIKENDCLRGTLEEICERYEELKSIYQKEEMSCKNLTESHKDISSRLQKAVRLLIDEKIARQTEKCRLEVITDESTKMKEENVGSNCAHTNMIIQYLLRML